MTQTPEQSAQLKKDPNEAFLSGPSHATAVETLAGGQLESTASLTSFTSLMTPYRLHKEYSTF